MSEYRNALSEGTMLHEFRIEKVLGQGGFGLTYKGIDTNLSKPVAIKEYFPAMMSYREGDLSVHPQSTKDQDEFKWGLERFIEEARVLAKFSGHPNIVTVLRYFELNGTGYIVMEFADGRDFDQAIEAADHISEEDLKRVLVPLLDGLDAVHKMNILHRDIKPANILLRRDGIPTLIDFGAARVSVTGSEKSMTTVYTTGYASNEQEVGSKQQGPWSDVYSMGAVAYKAITKKRPEGASARALHDELVPVLEFAAGQYSERFLAAIDKAMAVRIEDRYQSASEFRDAISDPVAAPQAPEKPKGNTKSLVMLAGGGAVAATIAAFFILPDLTPDLQETNRSFRQAESLGTIAAYQDFIDSYQNPVCILCDDARLEQIDQRINEAGKAIKSLRVSLAENDLWEQVQTKNTMAAYREYLAQYPYGTHATKAQAVFNRLKAMAELRANPTPIQYDQVGKVFPELLKDEEYKKIGENIQKDINKKNAAVNEAAKTALEAAYRKDTIYGYQSFVEKYGDVRLQSIQEMVTAINDRLAVLQEYALWAHAPSVASGSWSNLFFSASNYAEFERRVRKATGVSFSEVVKVRSLPISFYKNPARLIEVVLKTTPDRFGVVTAVSDESNFSVLDGTADMLWKMNAKHGLVLERKEQAVDYIQYYANNLLVRDQIFWVLSDPSQLILNYGATDSERRQIERLNIFAPVRVQRQPGKGWSFTMNGLYNKTVYEMPGLVPLEREKAFKESKPTFNSRPKKLNDSLPSVASRIVTYVRAMRVVR